MKTTTSGSVGWQRLFLAVKLALLSACAALTFVALLNPASHTQATPAVAQKFKFDVPLGLPAEVWESMIPKDNPMTAEKVALGEKLFFDKRLSVDRSVSCATCHDPATAMADSNMVGIGISLKKGARNTPTVLNAMFNETQFWDGRAATLEDQAKMPIINPIEMGMKDHTVVVTRIRAAAEYKPLFAAAFGSEAITIDTIAKAIAAFERTQVSGNSPFDRFMAGDQNAMSEAAKRGWELFNGQARCISCHAFNSTQPFFTDNKFHNIGVAAKDQNFPQLARRAQQMLAQGQNSERVIDELALSPGFSELGRYLITKQPKDIGAFKTSGLRDIELTAPYFHNGSEKTLLDVIKFYNKGGEPNPNLDGGMRPLKLTDPQMDDVVEFLKALTSDDVRRRAQSVRPQTRDPLP
ncbi:MAG: cytochrome c peroxidase [Blastocatellia bacterium]